MIRHALDTLPNCLPSSRTPTFVLITLSAVVISSLPSFSSSLILDYEDFITTVRLNCSTYINRPAVQIVPAVQAVQNVWTHPPHPIPFFSISRVISTEREKSWIADTQRYRNTQSFENSFSAHSAPLW